MTKKTIGSSGATPGGPGVNTIIKRNRDGTIRGVYYYHRATGERLKGEPGTPEYNKSLKAAERAGRAPAITKTPKDRKRTGIWTDIVDTYQKSVKYKSLAKNTKRSYDNVCFELIERLDWMTKKDVEDRRVRAALIEIRDEFAGRGFVCMGDHYVRVARMLLSFAYDRAMIGYNHALGIEQIRRAKPRAHIVFKPDVRAKILTDAHPDLAAAFELALYTAVRITDLCKLKWEMIDEEGWLSFQPPKTRNTTGITVHLPIFALERLEALIARLPREEPTILTYHGEMGTRPWTVGNLTVKWLEFRRLALGGPDLHWHDLRGTAVSEMLKAGCTDAEVAAVTGHALGRGSSIGAYAERSRELALAAFRKWNIAMQPKGTVVQLRRK